MPDATTPPETSPLAPRARRFSANATPPRKTLPSPTQGRSNRTISIRMHNATCAKAPVVSRAQTFRLKLHNHGGKDCHSLIEKAVKGAAFACGVQRWARAHLWRGFGGGAPNTLPQKESLPNQKSPGALGAQRPQKRNHRPPGDGFHKSYLIPPTAHPQRWAPGEPHPRPLPGNHRSAGA